MSDTTNRPPDDESDPLGRIIRQAGARLRAPDDVRARVYGSVHEAWQRSLRTRARSTRTTPWLALAAGVAAVAIGIAVVLAPGPAPAAAIASVRTVQGEVWIARSGTDEWLPASTLAGQSLAAGDQLRTAAGGRAALDLALGASLRLNEGTDLVLRAADRLHVENGTVYVDSGAASAGVRVLTPFGEVSDVGTQFEVRASEESLRIRVREGSVQYERPGSVLRGIAGEEISVPVSGEAVRGRIDPRDPVWDWVVDLATFRADGDYSAAMLLAWVSRETGRPVSFDSAETQAHAETLWLHGAEGLSPSETLDVIVATTDLRCDVEADAIVVHTSKN
jgi:hypothetical protein